MDKKDYQKVEIDQLRARVASLEQHEDHLKRVEEALRAANQQLSAGNQQLQASEQQLRALNEQLRANEYALKEKEGLAREAREYAENIIATIREPLLVLDSNFHVVSASRFFYTTFKVTPEKTEGKLFFELGNNQWDIPVLKNLLTNILPEKSVVEDYEIEHVFEKIGNKIMLLNARELRQDEEKKRRILLSIQDITERRQAEKNLKRVNLELEYKTEDLQQILYITTHDLRSPLVNIQGFNKELEGSLNNLAELMEDHAISESTKKALAPILDEEIPEAMHFITSSANKMDALLTGLLTLSRLGRRKLIFKEIDVNKLMQDVVDNFMYDINANNIVLNISDLLNCKGDEFQINQLFSNIVGNAMKFFDPERPGIITITGEKDANYIKYIIKDNGIGIHPDHQERVFELFHKLDPNKPGIGLGMNISKQIVEKHMGKIELESEVNRGTKISISLPE